jgi:AcrR family transcriptional regulator
MNKRSGKHSKEKILDAALKVFSEYGYKSASIKAIADIAQISVGGVYLYFRNKEELYVTLVKEGLNYISNKANISIKNIDDPVEAITEFIKVHLEYIKDHKELIVTHSREHGFTFGVEIKSKFFEEQRCFLEHLIRKGIDSGTFNECDACEAAKIIVGTLRGFMHSITTDPDNLFSPEEFSKLMLFGLLRNDKKAATIINES